jgi:hypothetical protein
VTVRPTVDVTAGAAGWSAGITTDAVGLSAGVAVAAMELSVGVPGGVVTTVTVEGTVVVGMAVIVGVAVAVGRIGVEATSRALAPASAPMASVSVPLLVGVIRSRPGVLQSSQTTPGLCGV